MLGTCFPLSTLADSTLIWDQGSLILFSFWLWVSIHDENTLSMPWGLNTILWQTHQCFQCLRLTEAPQTSLRMTQVASFWDHSPLLPHRPWWQYPCRSWSPLSGNLEVYAPPLYPRAFSRISFCPCPTYIPYTRLLAGTVPFRKQVHLFSKVHSFLQQGLVVVITGPSKSRKPGFQRMFCDFFSFFWVIHRAWWCEDQWEDIWEDIMKRGRQCACRQGNLLLCSPPSLLLSHTEPHPTGKDQSMDVLPSEESGLSGSSWECWSPMKSKAYPLMETERQKIKSLSETSLSHTCLSSQHLGSLKRGIRSSRPTWST